MSNNLETALVHEICPVCCKETNFQIVLNQKLTEHYARQVKEMNGKAVGFSEPCKECQENIDNGYIALIGFDPSKTETSNGHVKLENLYRTRLAFLKRHVADSIFGEQPRDFILLEDEVFDKLGVPSQTE